MKKFFSLILFFIALIITPLLAFIPSIRLIHTIPAMMLVAIPAVLAGAAFLKYFAQQSDRERWSWPVCLAVTTISAACLHVAASYAQEITNYPLTLYWSETSRFYYASLFFGERLYGIHTAPTVLHPSRYILQALPFLIPDSPLWLHRAWQSFLWVALPAAAGWLLARGLIPGEPLKKWLLAGLFFLYLIIGPVYYHLVVPVILMLWGFRAVRGTRRASWISLGALATASAWSGISRINWFPVAGMLAAALILIEQPIQGTKAASDPHPPGRPRFSLDRSGVMYFLRLAGWVNIGTALAFLAQLAYISWSGNQAEQFTTSFTSDLIWERLLPNATYPPGLLLATFLVSLPPALVMLGKLLADRDGSPLWKQIHPLRLLGLAAILAVLLTGGMVVSVKIGGGSNLHNIDAYMTLLGIIAAYLYFDRLKPDWLPATQAANPSNRSALRVEQIGLALLFIVIPFFAVFPRGPAEQLPTREVAHQAIQLIREAAEQAQIENKEVLFIGNRHLLTFQEMPGVPLVPDYERVFLMEVAMANDTEYLAKFYENLKNQRYGLIVSEPISRRLKDPRESFGAESNAWVDRVSRYILCYYWPEKTLRSVQVQLLLPRDNPRKSCP